MSTATVTFAPGYKLANGATVLLSRPHKNGGMVVLASFYDQAGKRTRDEFATWRCTTASDTSWGHYFDNLDDATTDFLAR